MFNGQKGEVTIRQRITTASGNPISLLGKTLHTYEDPKAEDR
jgi:hypothetical protein